MKVINILLVIVFFQSGICYCQVDKTSMQLRESHKIFLDTIIEYDVKNNYEEYSIFCKSIKKINKNQVFYIKNCHFLNNVKSFDFFYNDTLQSGYLLQYNRNGHLIKSASFDCNRNSNFVILFNSNGAIENIIDVSLEQMFLKLKRKYEGKQLYDRICAYFNTILQ